MSTISSPGLGSGLDVNTIVSQLMTVERQPLDRLKTQESKLQTRVSAFGKLQSALSTLGDAARALARPTAWQASKAASADATSVGVTSGSGAEAASHAVEVTRLAQRQAIATAPFAGGRTATPGAGTVRIQFGAVGTDGAFAPDTARAELSVSIGAGDTLEQVRDRINAAGPSVRASLVTDGSGARLVLRGTETGASQAFRVQVDDADGNGADAAGLSALAHDPSTTAGAVQVAQRTQSASDAAFTVDGLALTASKNTVADVLPGLTLELKRTTTSPVAVEVTRDTESMKTAVQKFADAYSALNKLLADQTKYDASSKAAGPLQGNRTAIGVQNQLRAMLRETVGGMAAGAPTRLSDIGLSVQRDGSLSVDATKLTDALADPDRVKALFGRADALAANTGLGTRFGKLTDALLGTDGAITAATESLSRQQKDIDRRQADGERRMTTVEARLLRQYTQLDQQMGEIQRTQMPGFF